MKKANSTDSASAPKGDPPPQTVDEYLAAVAEPARSTLNKVRAVIRSAAPRRPPRPSAMKKIVKARIAEKERKKQG